MNKLIDAPTHVVYDELDLRPAYARQQGISLGRHAAWIPSLGIKVPFQFAGMIQKYQHPQEQQHPRPSIGEEKAALEFLADRNMAPPIGRWVFFQTVLSEHLGAGAMWADPLGAWGYEMAPAEQCSPGQFTVSAMTPYFKGTPGAWNDLNKPGNVINGLLVDMRRSWWDRLEYLGPHYHMPESQVRERSKDLQWDLVQYGQFPFGERDKCYQEYALVADVDAPSYEDVGGWRPGERDVRTRYQQLGVSVIPGQSVVDIGCHVGGFLHAALLHPPTPLADHRLGVSTHLGLDTKLIGLDVRSEYIQLARRVARFNGWNLCFLECDAESQLPWLQSWLMALLPDGVDHLFLLSLSKHFFHGDATLEDLLGCLQPGHAYLESNAINDQSPWPLLGLVQKFGGKYVGDSTDRNIRRLYRIDLEQA